MLTLVGVLNATEAQTTAVLQGRVLDQSGAVVPSAAIRIRDDSTDFTESVLAGREGLYRIAPLRAGTYTVTAEASGFRTEVIEAFAIDVGRTLVRDFVLAVGTQSDTVVVRGNREEAVALVVNGVATNNMTFGSLIFERSRASRNSRSTTRCTQLLRVHGPRSASVPA